MFNRISCTLARLAMIVLFNSAPAAFAQAITGISIEGPATINASELLRQQYRILVTYADGSTSYNAAYFSQISGTAAAFRAGGELVVRGLGPVTIGATTQNYPYMTTTKNIIVTDGPDPGLPLPINCPADPAVGPLYQMDDIDTAGYVDMIPLCGKVMFVAHRRLNRIQAVDLAAGQVLGNWQLNSRPVQMIYRSGSGVLFALTSAGELARIDLVTGAMTVANGLANARSLAFGEPGEIIVLTYNSSTYSAALYRFDATTPAQLSTQTSTAGGYRILYHQPSHKLFVDTPARYSYNPATQLFSFDSYTPSGDNVQTITLSPDGRHLLVPSGAGNGTGYNIHDLDAVNLGQRFGEFDTGAYPRGADFRFDSRRVAATNGYDMQIFNVLTHALEVEIPMPQCDYASFLRMAYSPGGRNVFALYQCGFDGESGRIISLALPVPRQLAVARSGTGAGTVTSSPVGAGIACGTACTASVEEGNLVTLTATAALGSEFTGWHSAAGSASCSGTGTCSIVMALDASVKAGFAASPRPSPPVLVAAHAGDGRGTLRFTPPAYVGTSPVTGYTVTCNAGALVVPVAASPAILTGLSNGTSYNCTVTATNASGSSQPSAAVAFTPFAGGVPAMVGAVSRKSHGAAGTFDIDLEIAAAPPTVEPRASATPHLLELLFTEEISSIGQVNVTDAALGALPMPGITTVGPRVLLALQGVGNKARVTVQMSGLNGIGTAALVIDFLTGDVSGSHTVNAGDIAAVKASRGMTLGAGNFRRDIDASGIISDADLATVKSRTGASLP